MIELIRAYKVGVKDLPFLLLLIDFIWWVLMFFDVSIVDHWWISEIFSHSLAFQFYAGYYAIRNKHCIYTFSCLVGLTLINVLNILSFFGLIYHTQLYGGVILICTLSFALFKWKQIYFKKS